MTYVSAQEIALIRETMGLTRKKFAALDSLLTSYKKLSPEAQRFFLTLIR